MERIQFYPPEILKRVMLQDAKINGISISQLTVDILMEHYGLAVATENKKALSEIIDEVIDEVKTFVKDHPVGTTFDLLTASETFKNIHMRACFSVKNPMEQQRCVPVSFILRIFAASSSISASVNFMPLNPIQCLAR